MGRKKSEVPVLDVLVPSNLDLARTAAMIGAKPDVIAILLHQLVVLMVKRNAKDGWVPLKASLLRKLYRRAEVVFNGLEQIGVVQVQRNASGRKSYLGGTLAKQHGLSVSSTRYRLHPAYESDFKYHRLTDLTAAKAFRRFVIDNRNFTRAADTKNVPHKEDLKHRIDDVLDNKEMISSEHVGRFAPSSSSFTFNQSLASKSKPPVEFVRSSSTNNGVLPSVRPAGSFRSSSATTVTEDGRFSLEARTNTAHFVEIASRYDNLAALYDGFFAEEISHADFPHVRKLFPS